MTSIVMNFFYNNDDDDAYGYVVYCIWEWSLSTTQQPYDADMPFVDNNLNGIVTLVRHDKVEASSKLLQVTNAATCLIDEN